MLFGKTTSLISVKKKAARGSGQTWRDIGMLRGSRAHTAAHLRSVAAHGSCLALCRFSARQLRCIRRTAASWHTACCAHSGAPRRGSVSAATAHAALVRICDGGSGGSDARTRCGIDV